jgi:Raf kinase inhibitor-like YbhB/YbcL family protein
MNIKRNIRSPLANDGVNPRAGRFRSVPRRSVQSRASTAASMSVAFVVAVLAGFGGSQAYAQAPKFTLSSPDLAGNAFETKFTLNGFGCAGSNVSPALQWSNIPAGTKSLALQVHDLDGPAGIGLFHWAVYNIPPGAAGLPQGAGNSPSTLPVPAFGGNTDFLDTGATGANGNYGGPCPPVGDKAHRYVFTLYAVAVDDVQAAAGIPKTGTAALYSFILNKGLGPKLLGTASFTATYGR